jgi:hypothetical protein
LQGTGGRYFFPLFTRSKNLTAFKHLICHRSNHIF